MNYKKLFRTRELRYKILSMLEWIPDSIMLRFQYRIKMGYWPDLKTPKRFSEKQQVYKMKYRNPIMCKCVDKFDVRDYVTEKGLNNILNDLYGVYEKVEDIDFESLPHKFVVKSTIGGGGLDVIIVKDKNACDQEELFQKLSTWLQPRKSMDTGGREWAYTGIKKPRIVIEKLLEDSRQSDGSIEDYKFFCFRGKPYCVQVDSGRFEGHRQNYYDMEWKSLGVHCTYPEGDITEKPNGFEEMKKVASILSADFPFVRVDLYDIDGKVYFGELTFYPTSGYSRFTPDTFDFDLGKQFNMDFN